jgi:alkaline phosphatase D
VALFAAFLIFTAPASAQKMDSVYFTTGFRVGELTDSSAILWTRLCAAARPVPIHHAQEEGTFHHPIDFDDNQPVEGMDGAVAGAFGQVRYTVRSADTTFSSDWTNVSAYRDYTFKKRLSGLRPATRYTILWEGRAAPDGPVTTANGRFRTPPRADVAAPVTFTASTCQYFWSHDDGERGFRMYDSAAELDPAFHCQTGDYVYYDKPGPHATTVELARHKWHAINAWPALRDFYAQTPLYLQKDDHDLLSDDASPATRPYGELTLADGLRIWDEQTPVGERPYRTFRWGQDLQVWLVEGRNFRVANTEPDGPAKTIWGKEQKDWFKMTVDTSTATFKVLVSPTPVVGPDRVKKSDNHANAAFATEGDWLRNFLSDRGLFVVNGDRHWQYVSVDPETGLREFSQGPSSDIHAQGWSENMRRPEHRFLRVKGGFLEVSVSRDDQGPRIDFVHRDVEGREVNRETVR